MSASRFPEYHPGNLRVLKAVAPPPGSSLERQLAGRGEVAVFATTGDRSELDRMSGGDFDGDEVLICWDQALIPAEAPPEPPEYESAASVARTSSGDLSEMTVRSLRNASALLIGKLHRVWQLIAGRDPRGLHSDFAKEIDCLMNRELDAAKTGAGVDPAVLDDLASREFGEAWQRQVYDFMVVDKGAQAFRDATSSRSAAGSAAAIVSGVLRAAARSSKSTEEDGGRDRRLAGAWRDIRDRVPEHTKTAVLDVYDEQRRRASEAMAQRLGQKQLGCGSHARPIEDMCSEDGDVSSRSWFCIFE